MQVGVMITDGGPHPSEKWADQTASQIIDIAATAPESKLMEARAFREKIVEILTPHHAKVQEHERGKLAASIEHMVTPLDPSEHIDEAVDAIIAAAKGLSFEAHFHKPETRAYLVNLIGSHFATAMHIERSWHADRNPDSEHAKAFRAAHHPGAGA